MPSPNRPGDILITSYPKSGRTGIRMALHYYYNLKLNPEHQLGQKGQIPQSGSSLQIKGLNNFWFTHNGSSWNRDYVTPNTESKCVLIYRNVYDTLISAWYYRHRKNNKSLQWNKSNKKHFKWITDKMALPVFCEFYNKLDQLNIVYEINYSNLMDDKHLRKLITLIGDTPDESLIAETKKNLTFENLNNYQSFKFRKGIDKAYLDILTPEQIEYITAFVKDNMEEKYFKYVF